MGRRYNAERLKDKLNAKYNIGGQVISNAELLRRDQAVIENYKRDIEGRMMQTANQYVRDYFDKIGEEFSTGDDDNDTHTVINYLLSVTVRVLIEDFGWKPPRCANCRRTKTERFVNRVLEVIDDIRSDDKKDIRDYAKETADLYGISFTMEETNDS